MHRFPPGPRGIAALRCFERLRVDLLDELERLQAAHGDVVGVRGGGQRYVVLFHPDDVEEIYVRSAPRVRKGYAYRRAKRLLGRGMITSEGAAHLAQRTSLTPCMRRSQVSAYDAAMLDITDDAIADALRSNGAPVDLDQWVADLALRVICATTMGMDTVGRGAEVNAAINAARAQFTDSLLLHAPLLHALPLPATFRFRRARRTLRALVEEALDAGSTACPVTGAVQEANLVQLLNQPRDGVVPSRRQQVDEALTMMLAGHETNANTLVWALHLLAQHPQVVARMREEIDSVLGDEERGPTSADLDELPYVRAVFNETMRLYPQCYSMSRTTTEPVECPNVTLDAGTEVIIPQWTIHRDPRWWPDPERFVPERFLEPPGARPRYAFFPFGGGRRMCIGQPFAMLEGVVVLARVVQRLDLTPVATADPVPQPAFTLYPGSVPMRLTPRAAVST